MMVVVVETVIMKECMGEKCVVVGGCGSGGLCGGGGLRGDVTVLVENCLVENPYS